MKITISITPNSVPRNPRQCPIALALTAHFHRPVAVGSHFWYFLDETDSPTYTLPTPLIKWMRDFDKGFKELAPITLDL